MAIKDDVNEVKKVAGSEEQFLEGIIKSELFVRKYKKPILVLIVIAIMIPIFLATSNFVEDKKFKEANQAYSELITNPNDEKAKEKLKSSNKNLYTIFELRRALDNNETAKLNELANVNGIDPILKDIIEYSSTGKSKELMSSYADFMSGYKYLKEGNKDAANAEFVKIPPNSPLGNIARNLRHYNGEKQ